MTDERDEVRRRTDIVQLVGQRVQLRPSGKGYLGLCPFHDDRKPSFTVNPILGRYKCWSCGEGGDVFTWVMKTQGVEFYDALKELAQQAGVELHTRGPAPDRSERQRQVGIMEAAQGFFRDQFEKSPPTQQYAIGRGLDAQTIERWGLGYAPDSGEALVSFLRRNGHSLEEAKSLFLVDTGERGDTYAKFRGRLMFPIRDERGELVAFGGRLMRDGQPKYINSGDTPLYHKSRLLYGADLARVRWQKSRRATLCEGYLDVIACHRAGVDDAVASLGTSLTDEQAKLFERFVDRVTILYDADAAGQKAAARAVEILAKTKVSVRIGRMKPGDDPDTLLQRDGAEAVRMAVEEAISAFEFSLRLHEVSVPPADPDFWPRAIELLAAAPTEIEMEAQIERIAGLHPTIRDLRTAQEALRRDVGRLRAPAPESRPRRTGEFQAQTPLKPLEIAVFGAIIRPDLRAQTWPFLDFASYMITDAGKELARELYALFGDQPPEGEIDGWISDLSDASIDVLNTVTMDLRVRDLDIDVVTESIERLGLRSRRLGVRRIKERATDGDDDAARDAIDQIRKLKPP